MATLESAFNSTYSENASILTGNPDRVDVEVEDSNDEDFWSDLLRELCPEKDFHFNPYHTIINEDGSYKQTGKGKALIIKASAGFNVWHIGCVDSDYDWILSDYTNDGKTISGNKYLLQTYAYSIENLMCLSCTLGDFCSENTKETTEFDFDNYLARLSKAVYPLLVWSTYLYSKDNHAFTPTAWRDVLVNTEKNAEASLAIIEAKAKAKIEELNNSHASDIANKDIFESTHFCQKEITKENSYLYVRGHELFDHLLNSVINPIISSLRNQHYSALRASDTDEDSRKSALKEYQTKAKPIERMLSKNYRYKNHSPIYDEIKKDVSNIWE